MHSVPDGMFTLRSSVDSKEARSTKMPVLWTPAEDWKKARKKVRRLQATPGWRVHLFVDRVLFGKTFPRIHKKMDSAFTVLRRRHRLLYHDPLAAYAIALDCYPNDSRAVLAAQNHIVLDYLCTANPEYRRLLECMELQSRPKKTSTRKKRKRMHKDPVLHDMEKLAELKRLFRFLSGG